MHFFVRVLMQYRAMPPKDAVAPKPGFFPSVSPSKSFGSCNMQKLSGRSRSALPSMLGAEILRSCTGLQWKVGVMVLADIYKLLRPCLACVCSPPFPSNFPRQSVPAPSSNSLQATAFPAGATAAAGLPSMPSMPFGSGYGAQLSPIGMEVWACWMSDGFFADAMIWKMFCCLPEGFSFFGKHILLESAVPPSVFWLTVQRVSKPPAWTRWWSPGESYFCYVESGQRQHLCRTAQSKFQLQGNFSCWPSDLEDQIQTDPERPNSDRVNRVSQAGMVQAVAIGSDNFVWHLSWHRLETLQSGTFEPWIGT